MPYSKRSASPLEQQAIQHEYRAKLLEQYADNPQLLNMHRAMQLQSSGKSPFSSFDLLEPMDPKKAILYHKQRAAELRGQPTMGAYRPPKPQPTVSQQFKNRAEQLGHAVRSPWLEDKLYKMRLGFQQSGRVARDLAVGAWRTGGLGSAVDYAGSEFDRRMNQQTLDAVSRSRKLPEQVMQKLPQSTRRNMQATDALIQAQIQANSPYRTAKATVEATRQRNRAIAAGADPVQAALQWNRRLPILPGWANAVLSTRFVTPKSIRHLVPAARHVAPTSADLSNPEFLDNYYNAYGMPTGIQVLQLNGKPISISQRQAMQAAKLPQLQPYINTLQQLKSQDKLGVLNGQYGTVNLPLSPAADARFLHHLQPYKLTPMQQIFTGLPATYDPTQAANSIIIPSAGGRQFLPIIDYWNKNQWLRDAVDIGTAAINAYRQK